MFSMNELGQSIDGMIFRYAAAGYTVVEWRAFAALLSSFIVPRFRLSHT